MAEIRECPFCGGETNVRTVPSNKITPTVYVAGCRHCGIRTAPRTEKGSAIAAWNRRAPTWQPIETVPRDGTFFVICRAGEDDFYEVGRYEPQYWSTYVPVDGGLYRKDRQTINEWTHSNFHRATHWQPLPPPPAE